MKSYHQLRLRRRLAQTILAMALGWRWPEKEGIKLEKGRRKVRSMLYLKMVIRIEDPDLGLFYWMMMEGIIKLRVVSPQLPF